LNWVIWFLVSKQLILFFDLRLKSFWKKAICMFLNISQIFLIKELYQLLVKVHIQIFPQFSNWIHNIFNSFMNMI
jgi:hypothetical protein